MALLLKIINKILMLNQKLRVLYYKLLSTCRKISGKPNLHQPLLAVGSGKIKFGNKVNIGAYPSPFFYNSYAHFDVRGREAEINIGDYVWINNNCSLIADGVKILIGKDTLIGSSFSVLTSDFHNLDPKKRLGPDYLRQDVVIGNNVFIGSNVTILKGVTIGDNSVIGVGSIVTKSFPSDVVVAGNPAKIIKNL